MTIYYRRWDAWGGGGGVGSVRAALARARGEGEAVGGSNEKCCWQLNCNFFLSPASLVSLFLL